MHIVQLQSIILGETVHTCMVHGGGVLCTHVDSRLTTECLSENRGNDTPGKEWILKQRAGYGSHGNELVSEEELFDRLEQHRDGSELMLCQRLVTAFDKYRL